ncbi:hypothetical protein LTR36_003652 [Oleoguttula mirabilis]|uniref:WW domain-containing protein n=1 Tax=Oleoguttula mirabilis TaxID=1507867 RepID=A0AAV9JIN1_9PEZI|nr:hypothetical protein LTR36_003652 [Oleoguttula mirabilis]
MSFFGNRRDEEDERITETSTYSTDYDRGYGGGGGGYGGDPRRNEERVTETSTYYESSNNNAAPPPQVAYPWRAQWDDRERRYIFVNEQSGERTWELPNRGGYGNMQQETQTTTYYDEQRGGGQQYGGGGQQYGGGGYSGEQRVYQSEEVEQKKSGGHGLMYGAMGAAAGLAGGVFLAHEAGNVKDDYERDKYRVEDDVEDFPDNAAQWTGRKVGEVEDIPQDVEQGFDRFGNRIENGFDNMRDDVEDAPEDVAGWAGRKVGDVERFDDNVDNSYDQGKFEGRNDDRW